MSENIIRIGIFQKPEGLSVEEFRDYWHYHHAPIATNMHGMQKYDQNHCIKPVDLGLGTVSDRVCYGMSKIWFGSMNNQQSNDPDTMYKLAIDEKHLFKAMDLVVCQEDPIIDQDWNQPQVKYICLIKRNPAIDEDTFHERWANSIEAMKKVPGLSQLAHNIVHERVYNDIQNENRSDASYEQIPIDGVLELYFKFTENNAAGNPFATPEGEVVQALYREFVGDIAAYLVNSYRIV